ncbi:hypothetical protein PC116_g31579 [Phytophthora cactorum]|nr:hypothetical protein PC116_g31579 [Phytophthora cactorum]
MYTGKYFTIRSLVTVLTKLTCDLVGDEDLGGPGVLLWNYDPKSHGAANGTMFFFYESNHDFVPYKYTTVSAFRNYYTSPYLNKASLSAGMR